ncbi:hypothetical protein [Brumimicrobium glaciale]|uniref:hypothetical protein n=1 Tax=Brumimicrobium glaciale TaxID=200475 RepID=UPI0013ECD22F|nr:hypothetical protein [Brumimicrobium glaciale]
MSLNKRGERNAEIRKGAEIRGEEKEGKGDAEIREAFRGEKHEDGFRGGSQR